jgi:hypothetical protein
MDFPILKGGLYILRRLGVDFFYYKLWAFNFSKVVFWLNYRVENNYILVARILRRIELLSARLKEILVLELGFSILGRGIRVEDRDCSKGDLKVWRDLISLAFDFPAIGLCRSAIRYLRLGCILIRCKG